MIDARLEKLAAEFAANCIYVTIIEEDEMLQVKLPKPYEDYGMNLLFETSEDALSVIVWTTYCRATLNDFWTYNYEPKYILSQALLSVQTWSDWMDENL